MTILSNSYKINNMSIDMDITTLLLFLPACFALNLAPGPNNLLSINNATHYGFKISCIGGLGRLVAFIFMLCLASLGLAVVLHTSELIFYAIKFLGVAYLLYLAVQLWRAPVEGFALLKATQNKSSLTLMKQEFFVASGNPKAILIFTAFLPQFIDPEMSTGYQFAILGTLFLLLEFIAIMLYAVIGLYMKQLLVKPKSKRIFNRVCSSLLIFASMGLLLGQRSKS